MHLALSSVLSFCLLASAPRGDDPKNQGQATAPLRQRYRALVREHQDAVGRFWDVYQRVGGGEARRGYFQAKYPRSKLYIEKFLEIVDADPRDDAAVDSLIWIVRNGGYDPGVDRAVVRLTQEFAASPRLGEMAPKLVPNLVYSLSPSAEDLFRAIIERNPDRTSKGRACFALAQYLKQEAELVRSLKGDTPLARQIQAHYESEADKKLVEKLRDKDPDSLARDAAAAAERAEKDFADVADFLRILDPIAQTELFAAGSPGIGNAAPEIGGEAVGGQPMELRQLRGKVVVLLFWGDWSGPCRALYAPARSLAARMEGKPFALVGVDSDPDRKAVQLRIEREKITWPSWFDGGGRQGPIAARYKVPGWPTIYVIDHRGIIRHKWLGPPDEEMFDSILDEMVERAIKDAPRGPPRAR